MFRIGIIGSENSHAMAFAKIFNGLDPNCETQYPDMRVVAVGGSAARGANSGFTANSALRGGGGCRRCPSSWVAGWSTP